MIKTDPRAVSHARSDHRVASSSARRASWYTDDGVQSESTVLGAKGHCFSVGEDFLQNLGSVAGCALPLIGSQTPRTTTRRSNHLAEMSSVLMPRSSSERRQPRKGSYRRRSAHDNSSQVAAKLTRAEIAQSCRRHRERLLLTFPELKAPTAFAGDRPCTADGLGVGTSLDVARVSSRTESNGDSLPREGSVPAPAKDELRLLLDLSQKHQIPSHRIKLMRDSFLALDRDGNGTLSMDEFEVAIKKKCNLPAEMQLPLHLLGTNMIEADADRDGTISFDEFLVWSNARAFTEELICPDPSQREIRNVARELGISLPDVEKAKLIFDKFDVDKSRSIDEEEFRQVLIALVFNGKDVAIPDARLRLLFQEVDIKRNGVISFKEFASWYFTSLDAARLTRRRP